MAGGRPPVFKGIDRHRGSFVNLEQLLSRMRSAPVAMDLLRWFYDIYNYPRKRMIASVKAGQSRARFEAGALDGAELLSDREELLRKMPPNSIAAEIGVDNGDYSMEILSLNAPKELHLIDLWGSLRYSGKKMARVKEKVSAHAKSEAVRLHRMKSIDAAELFSNGYFDFVYIDTDHSYTTTISELRAWAPKVKPGGFILGHDFVDGNFASGIKYGVVEAVAEFLKDAGWHFSYLTMDHHENQSFGIQRPENA